MGKKKKTRKIALLSDVHGNLPALEAVLADAAAHAAEEFWNLGDVLGYAPFPNEVVQTLRDVDAANVIGNYDQKVLAFARKKSKWQKKKAREKYVAFEWNHQRLAPAGRTFLESLPEQRKREVGGLTALLVHGSPASVDELLGSATPDERLQELAQRAGVDLIVCGHSHEAFARRVEGTWFVNPGSVGRPEGGDWRAAYALIEIADGAVRVEQRRVAYDIERVARGVHAAGLPPALIDVFRKGKSLNQLADEAVVSNGAKVAPNSQRARELHAVLALAQNCDYERQHTHQVTELALKLFDELRGLHGLGTHERFWLQCGALLHDIGWTEGQQGHHKTALRLIIGEPRLPWPRRQREIIGLIARYHRKALPHPGHKYFGGLSTQDRRRVRVLAGVLRVADGLDRTHTSVIDEVACRVSDRAISIVCRASGAASSEVAAASKKAELLREVFGREVKIAVLAAGQSG